MAHLELLLEYICSGGGPRPAEVHFERIVPRKIQGVLIGYGPANFRFVEGFLAWLVDRKRAEWVRGGQRAPTKVLSEEDLRDKAAGVRNRALGTLRLFFRYLVEDHILYEDPTYHVEPAQERQRINHNKYLRPDDSGALVHAAIKSGKHAPRNVALVATVLRSGLRPEELCNLTAAGVEYHTQRLRTHGGKRGQRSAPMPPALAEVLHLFQRSSYFKTRNSTPGPLFRDDDGTSPLTSERLLELLKPLFEAAGIEERVTTYWLRHTFATDLNRLGVSIPIIGRSLGDKRIKNVIAYTHEREPRLRRIVEDGPASRPLVRVHRKVFHVLENQKDTCNVP